MSPKPFSAVLAAAALLVASMPAPPVVAAESGVAAVQVRGTNRTPRTPSQEDVAEKAREIVASTGADCRVTGARLLGRTGDGQTYYEAACEGGPGFILSDAETPQAIGCILLASQARVAREADPEAEVGLQCGLPGNTEFTPILAGYAAQAGVTCTVDDGMAVGRNSVGSAVYEVGCAGVQGYWLEQADGAWVATECLQVITQNSTCRFTTPEEGAASVKAMLAGTEGADCDVTEARFMGGNANGRFYEAKCAAGNGLIARVRDTSVQQVYPCDQAQRIGGGCTLTQVAAAPATTEQN